MKTDSDYCNVLVVNVQSMTEENATCITMRSLFDGWPPEKICEVSVGQAEIQSDFLKTVTLSNEFFPLRKLFMSGFGAGLNKKMKSQPEKSGEKPEKPGFKENLRQLFYTMCDCTPIFKRKKIIRKIGEFKPDVIYTIGCSVLSLKLANFLAEHYKINIVIHFMDNWIEALEWNSNVLLKPYHAILIRNVRKCCKHTEKALAISAEMARHYTEILGVPHEYIMNSISVRDFSNEPKEKIVSPIHITYTGGLHLKRWSTLKAVEEQIRVYAEKTNETVILDVYTSAADRENYSKLFNERITVFHDYVKHEEIPKIYFNSDILIHAETLDSDYNSFFKYSVSTKIPEYLASGRPIIVLCPRSMYLYEYLNKNNAAYVSDNANDFLNLFESLLNNKTERMGKISSALALAEKNHDISVSHKKFELVLEENKC